MHETTITAEHQTLENEGLIKFRRVTRHHICLILLLGLMTAFDAMTIDLYLPGFSAIRSCFDTDVGTVQMSLSVFLVGLALGQAICGPFIDRFGRLLPLLTGLVLFVLTSVVIAMSPNIGIFIGGRFFQGLGAAVGLVIPRAIISDLFDGGSTAKIYSLLMQVMLIAPIIAPPVGSLMLHYFDWTAIFWLLAFLGLATLLGTIFTIKETLPKSARISAKQFHLLKGYADLLRNRSFLRLNLSGGFVMSSLFAYISASPFIFTEYFKLSPTHFSYLFAVNAIGMVLSGQLNFFLLRNWTDCQLLSVGILMHVGATGILFVAIFANVNNFYIIAGLIFISLASLGLVCGNMVSVIMKSTREHSGSASAFFGVTQYVFGSLAGVALGLLHDGSMRPLTIVMLICAVAARLLLGRTNMVEEFTEG